MPPIRPIAAITIPELSVPSGSGTSGGDFAAILKSSLGSVEGLSKAAHQSAERFLSGEGEEIHEVALAAQKAELAFELFVETRNKVVEAYQEVMRMQI